MSGQDAEGQSGDGCQAPAPAPAFHASLRAQQDQRQPRGAFQNGQLQGRVTGQVAAVGEDQRAQQRRYPAAYLGAQEGVGQQAGEKHVGHRFHFQGAEGEAGEAGYQQDQVVKQRWRVEDCGLWFGQEGIAAESAGHPNRQPSGAQFAESESAVRIKVIGEIACRKSDSIQFVGSEVAPEEQSPQNDEHRQGQRVAFIPFEGAAILCQLISSWWWDGLATRPTSLPPGPAGCGLRAGARRPRRKRAGGRRCGGRTCRSRSGNGPAARRRPPARRIRPR